MNRKMLFIVSLLAYLLISCDPQPIEPPAGPVVLKDTTILNIPYGSISTNQKLDLGLPANRTAATPLLIVVHGGGWSVGDKNELTWLLNGMKQRGFAVANINYRLTLDQPDNYKMQLDDLDSAIQFTLRRAAKDIFNGQKLYIVGHSAGGHLSLCYAYTRNSNGKVKAVGSMAGPTNLFNMGYYNPVVYNGILVPFLGIPLIPTTSTSIARYQDCSPFYQVKATSPATILFHGEADPVVNPEQSAFLFSQLTTLNVDRKIKTFPFIFHDWWTDGAKMTETMDLLKDWFTTHP